MTETTLNGLVPVNLQQDKGYLNHQAYQDERRASEALWARSIFCFPRYIKYEHFLSKPTPCLSGRRHLRLQPTTNLIRDDTFDPLKAENEARMRAASYTKL